MADGTEASAGTSGHREWELLYQELRREIADTRAWVERVDTHGTRNAGVTEAKVIDNAAAVAETRAELRAHLAAHQRVVEAAEARAQAALEEARKARAEHRKWLIATAAGTLGGAAGWAGVLYEVMHHAHP